MKSVTLSLDLKPWVQAPLSAVVSVLGPRVVVGASDEVAAAPDGEVVQGHPVLSRTGLFGKRPGHQPAVVMVDRRRLRAGVIGDLDRGDEIPLDHLVQERAQRRPWLVIESIGGLQVQLARPADRGIEGVGRLVGVHPDKPIPGGARDPVGHVVMRGLKVVAERGCLGPPAYGQDQGQAGPMSQSSVHVGPPSKEPSFTVFCFVSTLQ